MSEQRDVDGEVPDEPEHPVIAAAHASGPYSAGVEALHRSASSVGAVGSAPLESDVERAEREANLRSLAAVAAQARIPPERMPSDDHIAAPSAAGGHVLFDGPVWTSYAQLTLVTGSEETPLPDDAFRGQRNGLCGATVPGSLFLITGTHTGEIPVRVSMRDAAPELGDWEEIVEASLVPTGASAAFAGWAGAPVIRFGVPAPAYRVRWNATGMDAGADRGAPTEDDPAPDRYELMLWPAPPTRDAVLRRTSAQAAYWHDRGFTRR